MSLGSALIDQIQNVMVAAMDAKGSCHCDRLRCAAPVMEQPRPYKR